MPENIQQHILVVDDDPQIRALLEEYLAENGLRVSVASTGKQMSQVLADEAIDLLVLDLRLAGEDGMAIARSLREQSAIPIVMLTGVRDEADRVMGLELGADDYLTKPFSLPELLARIRVAERHTERRSDKKDAVFILGDLRIDLVSRVVTVAGDEVRLTPIEYKLLATLARRAGRVLTYQQLLKEVWGPRYATQKQYLHVYMGHLRNKLEQDPARPRFLLTEPGVGYRLKLD